MRWRRRIVRWRDWSRRSGQESASTLIVVAGDHGEAFGEHGEISHSIFVYDTTLRVPLVIAGPGIAPSSSHGAVGLVDVAPTMLAAARRRSSSTRTGST